MSAGELTEKLGLQNLRNRRVSDLNISPCLYQERIVVEIASYVESYKDSRVKMNNIESQNLCFTTNGPSLAVDVVPLESTFKPDVEISSIAKSSVKIAKRLAFHKIISLCSTALCAKLYVLVVFSKGR